MDTLEQILDNLWTSVYVQKNPSKAYKSQYNAEYLAVAEYMNGGQRPNTTSYSKMGKVLVGLEDQIRASTPSPPPPTAWTGPVEITTGGIHNVSAESNSATPAVTVRTPQPVTLVGRARNLTGQGVLVDAIPGGPVRLTVENFRAYGGDTWQTSNRFLWTTNHHTLIVRNCTIENTTGIEVNGGVAGGSVLITKNRHLNVKGYIPGGQIIKIGNFVQFRTVTSPTIEVSWNENVNEYNKSFPEDIVSIYHTSNVKVLDNFLFGQYAIDNVAGASIGGITLDASDAGPPVNNCLIARNQIVDGHGITLWPNIGGGSNNIIEENRVVADRYLPNGQQKNNGWVGILIKSGGSNNVARDNKVGYWTKDGGRTDYIFEGGAVSSNNTSLPEPILEQAEWVIWRKKLADNGITIGAA